MVIIPSIKTAYVHMPKTGGMALSNALLAAFPDACWLDSHRWMHAGPGEIRSMVSYPLKLFTVIREPKDIFESHYCWVHHCVEHRDLPDDWFLKSLKFQARLSFYGVCQHMTTVFGTQGFVRRWSDDSTELFLYEDEDLVQKLCDYLGREINPQPENLTEEVPRPQWDEATNELVETYAWYEYETHYKKSPRVSTGA